MDLTSFGQQLFNGVSVGSVYALVAVGITIVFGLTRLVNFAHGEIVAVGAYTVLVLAAGGGPMFAVGLLGAVVVTGLLSLVLERGLFRFTIDKPINGFLISLGLILIIQNVLTAQWTINPQHVQPAVSTVWEWGGIRFTAQRVMIIVATAAIFAGLALVVTKTWYGRAARAAAMDREMLALTGAPVERVIMVTFVVGGALGGVAGAFIATLHAITPLIGFRLILKAFAIAIVGGLGSVSGAVLMAFLFGIFESLAIGLGVGAWVEAMLFAVLVLMVLVRPQGLLRGTEGAVE